MKYQCENKHQFIHPAKETFYHTRVTNVGTGVVDEFPIDAASATRIRETSVCPFCYSLVFDEIPEPQVESIKSVPINEADDWFAKGYELASHTKDQATIVKKKVQEK